MIEAIDVQPAHRFRTPAGERRLAVLAGLSDSNIPPILRKLVEKQAIEVRRAPRHNDGKML